MGYVCFLKIANKNYIVNRLSVIHRTRSEYCSLSLRRIIVLVKIAQVIIRATAFSFSLFVSSKKKNI